MASAGAKLAAAGGQAATSAISGVHSELPLPQAPQWSGYWTFVVGAIVVMFILFTAQRGTLKTWLGFLWPSTPIQPLATVGASAAGALNTVNAASQAAGAAVGAASTVAGTSATGGASNPSTGANLGLGN